MTWSDANNEGNEFSGGRLLDKLTGSEAATTDRSFEDAEMTEI